MKSSRPRKSPKTGKSHQWPAKTNHPQMGHPNLEDHAGSNFRGFRGRYVVQGVAVVGLLGLTGVGLAFSAPSIPKLNPLAADFGSALEAGKQAQQIESPPVEDKVPGALYSRVMRVRQEIAMGNDDLAALGLTEAQAEDVLTRLLDWVAVNQTAMIRADNATESARQSLVEMERRIRVGEADEQEARSLVDLRRAVTTKESACRALYSEAGSHAIAPATGSVRTQWLAASTYRALPLELRHIPNLNQQRVDSLLDAITQHTSNPNRGASDSRGGGGVNLRGALPLSSVQSMDEVRTRVQSHRAGVAAAEASVLPMPAEMRVDEAGMAAMDEQDFSAE